jgi:hypothetical protein
VLFQRAWKPADIVLITAVPQQDAKPLHRYPPVHVTDEALDTGVVRKILCRCLGEDEDTWDPRFRPTLAGEETVPLVRIDPDTVVERDQTYQRIG